MLTKLRSAQGQLWWRILKRLNLIGAAAFHLNPFNYESPWRPFYETIARQALQDRTKAADVFTEFDIFLDTKGVSPDISSSLDPSAARACRPDLALAYYGIRKATGRHKVHLNLQIAVLFELKRSPPRTMVALDDGLPYNEAGQKAIDKLISKAQVQVASQGALYLRTPAARDQDELLLVAASGVNAAYTIMTRDNVADTFRMETWRLVSDLADARAEDEDEALQTRFVAPQKARRKGNKPSMNRPSPSKAWLFDWKGLLDAAGPEFLDALNRYLDRFELKFKERYPDSFDASLMPCTCLAMFVVDVSTY